MNHHLFSLALAAVGIAAAQSSATAQTMREWQDPGVNQVNRLPMHASYFAYESEALATQGDMRQSARHLSLDGQWKFQWVADATARPTTFFQTGYDDGAWGTMAVPGMWELNGYGDPIYVNTGYAWRNQFKNNPPEIPTKGNHVGSYRRWISVPASWKGKDIIAHFGSATSCIYVWVNGKFVGYSEDSKLEAEFNLTPYLTPGKKNLVALQMMRWCDGTYLEDQDFFRFSGLARHSYLYARDKKRVEDIRVTPDLDERYQDGSLAVDLKLKGSGRVTLTLKDAEGRQVATATARGAGRTVISGIKNPEKWSAEQPYLYTLTAQMEGTGEVIPVKVGFRKIELKGAQILVNGQPVLFKGANRHELDPDGGYVVSRERMEQDVRIMKQMGINAVRTCHYPDDSQWYDLCDEYGLYMVAEANLESHGMGYKEHTLAKNTQYARAHMERNERNVQRNFNHPAIIFWSLGNEAGFGPNFEAVYRWIKKEDPSRAVQYEQAHGNEFTDIDCPMYASYDHMERYAQRNDITKPLIQCEYAHAMGNSIGGFKEYWDLIRKYPALQGGFIWDFVDQGIRWTNPQGQTFMAYGGDFNRYDASDNNFCVNGLISPDRVLNPHAREVAYYYQNIWTTPVDLKRGTVEVYNENFFRSLKGYDMEYQLLRNGRVHRAGRISTLATEPQTKEQVQLELGQYDAADGAEWLLNVAYKLQQTEGMLSAGTTVARQQMVIAEGKAEGCSHEANEERVKPAIDEADHNVITISGNGVAIDISRHTGLITRLVKGGKDVLADGAELRPNFWRAPTDNDFGAGLQRRWSMWRNPEMRLTDLKTDASGHAVKATATIDMPHNDATLTLVYAVSPCGKLTITQKIAFREGTKATPMLRFGMTTALREGYEQMAYHGRGPSENYADRNSSEFIGRYEQTVSEQFYPYMRPQETGNHTDLRSLTLSGHGLSPLHITAPKHFGASALHYSQSQLDDGNDKHQSHPEMLTPSKLTYLHIDGAQMGLGCVDSWRSLPREEYQLKAENRTFTFVIK